MIGALRYEFMQNALTTALLASVACGVIGSLVVTKKITFISGGIAHASFGGIGLGYFLGINPLYALLPFSLVSALGIGLTSRRLRVPEDTTIGVFWAVGMALGVVFIGLTPGYAPDLFSYLFGNILTVPRSDVLFMLLLDVVIVSVVSLLFKEFLAVSFDEEYAEASGLRVDLIYLILLALVALTVVLLVRIVGIVLVIALLTIPAAIAKMFTFSLKWMMVYATLIGMGLSVAGLWVSYLLDMASGATIIILSGIAFTALALSRSGRRAHSSRRA
jgi:zinc transport system permease protein